MYTFASASQRLRYEIRSRVNICQIQMNICTWEKFFKTVMSEKDYIKNIRDQYHKPIKKRKKIILFTADDYKIESRNGKSTN